MAFIPVPRGASLCFFFTSAGQEWQFCVTVQKRTGDPTEADLQNLADDGFTWWGAGGSSGYTSQATGTNLYKVVATDLTAEGAPQRTHTENLAGGGGAGALPTGTAVVASLRTALRGRSYRGRVYLGGLASALQSTAIAISGASATSIASYFTDLMDILDLIGFDLVVASKQHNGAVVNPANVQPVTSVIVDTLFDSQRRRLGGRGA